MAALELLFYIGLIVGIGFLASLNVELTKLLTPIVILILLYFFGMIPTVVIIFFASILGFMLNDQFSCSEDKPTTLSKDLPSLNNLKEAFLGKIEKQDYVLQRYSSGIEVFGIRLMGHWSEIEVSIYLDMLIDSAIILKERNPSQKYRVIERSHNKNPIVVEEWM